MADTTKAAKAAEGAAALKVHHLRPAPGARSAKIRVGRGEGGKRGKTAGRGTKGTKARYQVPEGFQGGHHPAAHAVPEASRLQEPVQDRVPGREPRAALGAVPQGGDVTVEDLVAKGAVRDGHLVKVLGSGEITVAVHVTATRSPAAPRRRSRRRAARRPPPDPTR